MVRIVVTGDTHIRRWEQAHDALRAAIAAADIAIHCGDWTHLDAVAGFRASARRAVVVHGNSDPRDLRDALPYRELIEVEGVRIGVTHPAWGGPEFPPERLFPDFPDEEFGRLDVICYGHIHEPLNAIVDGVRFVNPGQGYPSFMVPGTYALLEINRGHLHSEIVEFAPAQ
jgi:uncharacterized protein